MTAPSWSANLGHINSMQSAMLGMASGFASNAISVFNSDMLFNGGDGGDGGDSDSAATGEGNADGTPTWGSVGGDGDTPSLDSLFGDIDFGDLDFGGGFDGIFGGFGSTGSSGSSGPSTTGSVLDGIWGMTGGLLNHEDDFFPKGDHSLCEKSFLTTSSSCLSTARDARRSIGFPDISKLLSPPRISVSHQSTGIRLNQPNFLTRSDVATFDANLPTLADINAISPRHDLQPFNPNTYSVTTDFAQFSAFVPAEPPNPLTGLGEGPSLALTDPYTIALPGDLVLADVAAFGIGDAPVWVGEEPNYDFSGAPGPAPSNWVGTAPGWRELQIPVYDGAPEPPEPSLLAIPDVPIRDPSLPDLYIEPSDIPDFPEINGSVDYTDPGYAGEQLTRLEAEVARVLDGSLGIPDSIWDQIWTKTLDQLTRQGVAQKRQARREWAKLGWMMPGGIALAGQVQAQHDINQQLSLKALEQATQRAIQEREDFWKAFQSGVAIEEIQVQLYNAQQERALKTAMAQAEALVSLYNAIVARTQAEVSRTQALVAVKEMQLRGALATLEVDKAKLDAAKLKGEINQLAVQVYVARWEAVKNAIEKWKVAMSAVDYQVEERKLGLARYGEELKAWLGELDGWSKEWDGYVAKIEGQKTIAQTYETSARVFSERMKGYSINAEAEKTRVEADIASRNMEIERHNADIRRFQAGWEAIRNKLTADVGKYEVDSRIFTTKAEQLRAHSQNRLEHEKTRLAGQSFMVDVEKAKADVEASRVQALAAAYEAHTRGYIADIDGQTKIEAIKADLAKAMAAVMGAKAQAYDAESRMRVGEFDARVRLHDVDTRLTESKLKAEVDERQIRVGYASAEAQNNSAFASFYGHAVNRANAMDDVNAKLVGLDLDLKRVNIEEGTAKGELIAARIKALADYASASASAAQAQAAGMQAQASGMQAQAAGAQAQASGMQAQAAMAEANAAVASVQATVAKAQADYAASVAKINADITLGEAQIKTSHNDAMAKINADWVIAQGQAMASLAAASLSAINISSGASASDSSSYSAGNSYSYGESHSETLSKSQNLTPSTSSHNYSYAMRCCED